MSDKSPRKVAQYLRMSTERQTYSLEYQAAANLDFARGQGWSIVKSYADPGVSGLTLNARPGLKDLLADVLGGAAAYDGVLVYDVSRWGRFQDVDQGAHYEFLCREAGVQVVYTAEPFTEDGSLASAILKHLKRVMAAEYSRELSAKTSRAQKGLQAEGFWVGGAPGYGLRRVLVTTAGAAVMQMARGQHKALHGHRTRLVLGPDEEVATVRRIYRLFVYGGMRMVTIAARLNAEGVPAEAGALWTRQRIRNVLTNEKYVGVLVGGKSVSVLRDREARPPSAWVRVAGCLEPIVSRAAFDLAQAQIPTPKRDRVSDEQLVEELRRVWSDCGRLSSLIIDAHPAAHSADFYKRRFRSLEAAYRRVGYQPSRRQQVASDQARTRANGRFKPRPEEIDANAAWAQIEAHYRRLGRISSNTLDVDPEVPSAEWCRKRFGGMGEIYARLGYEPSARQKFHLELTRPGTRKYRRPA